MPMIDACIPEGALTDEAESKLFDELREILVTSNVSNQRTSWRAPQP